MGLNPFQGFNGASKRYYHIIHIFKHHSNIGMIRIARRSWKCIVIKLPDKRYIAFSPYLLYHFAREDFRSKYCCDFFRTYLIYQLGHILWTRFPKIRWLHSTNNFHTVSWRKICP